METHEKQPPPYDSPAQPYPAQPYPAQPYPAQPYPQQPYPQQPYPQQPYGQPVTATTVVAGAPQHTVIVQQAVGPRKPESYLILSCVIFWCCNCLFGGIAFIFSMMSQSAADRNDLEEARRMGRISLWLNVAGIIVTIIIIVVVVVLYFVFLGSFVAAYG